MLMYNYYYFFFFLKGDKMCGYFFCCFLLLKLWQEVYTGWGTTRKKESWRVYVQTRGARRRRLLGWVGFENWLSCLFNSSPEKSLLGVGCHRGCCGCAHRVLGSCWLAAHLEVIVGWATQWEGRRRDAARGSRLVVDVVGHGRSRWRWVSVVDGTWGRRRRRRVDAG